VYFHNFAVHEVQSTAFLFDIPFLVSHYILIPEPKTRKNTRGKYEKHNTSTLQAQPLLKKPPCQKDRLRYNQTISNCSREIKPVWAELIREEVINLTKHGTAGNS
jgi:hypothetical protein